MICFSSAHFLFLRQCALKGYLLWFLEQVMIGVWAKENMFITFFVQNYS